MPTSTPTMSTDWHEATGDARADGAAYTKVVATIGPASSGRIGELIDAGMSVARINFSHGSVEDHQRAVESIRRESERRHAAVGILADIQGPKLRVGRFEGGALELAEGQRVRLVECDPEDEGVARAGEIGLGVEGLIDTVLPGQRVFLADGAVELEVEGRADGGLTAVVRREGTVGDRKGIHLPDSRLSIELPTPKDMQDIALALELGVDMLGLSFVRSGEDVLKVRTLAPDMAMVAKIERAAALDNLDAILAVSDGVMVARGDLGVEVRLEQLPIVQKHILSEALRAGRFTITATEMLESMVHSSRPTRAEVTDVANAVLDGTDAVMLSAETAVGQHPIESVRSMNRIACAVEHSRRYHDLPRSAFRQAEPTFPNAVAMSAARAAEALGLQRIVCFTESGNTVRLLSRYRPDAELIAITPHLRTQRVMTVLAHVRPLLMERRRDLEDMIEAASELLLERGLVRPGEGLVFVGGVPPGTSFSTNMMKLHRVGDRVRR